MSCVWLVSQQIQLMGNLSCLGYEDGLWLSCIAQRNIREGTVSVVTLSLRTLTLFFCGEIVRSLEAKQALELQTVGRAERQDRIPVCVTCPHLVICGFPCMAFGKVHAAAAAACYFTKKGPTRFTWHLKNW